MSTPLAGSEELREQIEQWHKHWYGTKMSVKSKQALVDLITSSHQQLLRELEAEVEAFVRSKMYKVYATEDGEASEMMGNEIVKAVPLSVIEAKLKQYGGEAHKAERNIYGEVMCDVQHGGLKDGQGCHICRRG